MRRRRRILAIFIGQQKRGAGQKYGAEQDRFPHCLLSPDL
jgi:hypothetical protein